MSPSFGWPCGKRPGAVRMERQVLSRAQDFWAPSSFCGWTVTWPGVFAATWCPFISEFDLLCVSFCWLLGEVPRVGKTLLWRLDGYVKNQDALPTVPWWGGQVPPSFCRAPSCTVSWLSGRQERRHLSLLRWLMPSLGWGESSEFPYNSPQRLSLSTIRWCWFQNEGRSEDVASVQTCVRTGGRIWEQCGVSAVWEAGSRCSPDVQMSHPGWLLNILGFDCIVSEMKDLPWMISTLPLLHPSVSLWVSLTFCPFTIVISCCQAAAVVPRRIEILDNRLYGGNGNDLQVQSCLLAPS